MKRIETTESCIRKEKKQNMCLDEEITSLQTNIDEKRFTNDYSIHEKELFARNER